MQTDHRKEFDNTEMKLFCENNKIQYITSSVKYPWSNGTVEIIHRYKGDYLVKWKKELKSNFDIEVALDEFVIYHNNKKHSITKYIPIDISHTDVINNIIKFLTYKIKKGDNIISGCFVLDSTKTIFIIKLIWVLW